MAWSRLTLPLAFVLLPVAAWAAPVENRVAVLEARPIDLPDLGPHALREAVVDGIKAQGAVVLDGALGLPPEQLATCNTPECYKAVSQATGATHVLRIDGTFADDRYELQIQIWNRQTGEIVASDRERCKLCLAEDMLRIARGQTAYVIGKAFASHEAVASATVSSPALKAGTNVGDKRADSVTPGQAPPHRWLGWTLVAVGAASAAGGLVEWGRDKQAFDCADIPGEGQQCLKQHRTQWAALSLAGLAVASGGVGAWLLLRKPGGGAEVSLSIAPSWVGLGGAF